MTLFLLFILYCSLAKYMFLHVYHLSFASESNAFSINDDHVVKRKFVHVDTRGEPLSVFKRIANIFGSKETMPAARKVQSSPRVNIQESMCVCESVLITKRKNSIMKI